MIRQIGLIFMLFFAASAILNAGLTVKPARQELIIAPGGTFEGSFDVTNDSDKLMGVDVESRYWYVAKEEEKNIKVSDWFQVTPTSFTFEPNATKEVKYSVKLSTGITGMRAIMVSFVPQGQEGVTLIVSVSLFVTIRGTEKVDWYFSDAKISNFQGSTQISAIVSNNGNVHIRPAGYVKIISKKKKEMVLQIPEGRPAYPGQTRMVAANGTEKEVFPEPGKYKVILSLTARGETKEKTYKVKVEKNGVITVK